MRPYFLKGYYICPSDQRNIMTEHLMNKSNTILRAVWPWRPLTPT